MDMTPSQKVKLITHQDDLGALPPHYLYHCFNWVYVIHYAFVAPLTHEIPERHISPLFY